MTNRDRQVSFLPALTALVPLAPLSLSAPYSCVPLCPLHSLLSQAPLFPSAPSGLPHQVYFLVLGVQYPVFPLRLSALFSIRLPFFSSFTVIRLHSASSCFVFLKQKKTSGLESWVSCYKSCSCREPKLDSWHPHGGTQPSTTTVAGDPTSVSDLCRHQVYTWYIDTCGRHSHT